jgi:hypothetical protein
VPDRVVSRFLASLAAFAGIGVGLAPTVCAEDVAFPLTGRQTVKANGKRYVIDGKQTLVAGAVIRVEAGVKIAGINGASLDVRGGLKVHGTSDGRVDISRVDFSPTVAPDNEVHLDEVDLTGCDFATPDGASFTGGLTIENASIGGGRFAVRMKSGYLRIMSVRMNTPCAIEAVPDKGRPPEIAIRGGTLTGLTFSGNAAATIRSVDVKGRLEAKDFTDLVVDACDLHESVVFRQSAEGSFSKLQLLKCNLLAGAGLTLARPKGPSTKPEKVRLDKFHFGTNAAPDLTDKRIAERITDGADDDTQSVRAWWQNPQERPH